MCPTWDLVKEKVRNVGFQEAAVIIFCFRDMEAMRAPSGAHCRRDLALKTGFEYHHVWVPPVAPAVHACPAQVLPLNSDLGFPSGDPAATVLGSSSKQRSSSLPAQQHCSAMHKVQPCPHAAAGSFMLLRSIWSAPCHGLARSACTGCIPPLDQSGSQSWTSSRKGIVSCAAPCCSCCLPSLSDISALPSLLKPRSVGFERLQQH
jgi:hypothetical protein